MTNSGRNNKKISGERSRQLDFVIADMVNRGIGTREISDRTGCSYGVVAARVYKLRCNGVLPLFKGRPFYGVTHALKKSGRRTGNMKDLFDTLGADVSEWVVKNTPDESSASEFIAAIVRDAWFDDTGRLG